MLKKVDLDEVFGPEEEIEPSKKVYERDITKELTIQGYSELCIIFNQLVDYIDDELIMLLDKTTGLTKAQQEIKYDYEKWKSYFIKDFELIKKLLIERQKLINERKGE